MVRILCTGDSHTWGQGAAEIMEEMTPPAVAGDLRLTSFRAGSYVNQVRRFAENMTGSRSYEWTAIQIAKLADAAFAAPCARLNDNPLVLKFSGSLLRVEYMLGETPCQWELMIDGAQKDGGLLPAADCENSFRLSHIHLAEGTHTLSIRAAKGILPLFRIESYAGDVAVINGGIGSCPTQLYLERYFNSHVATVKPDVVLAEAHTINDWLSGISPATYTGRLEALLRACQRLGARVYLMTVSPIGGSQTWEDGLPYSDYVEASRKAASCAGVSICDANRLLSHCIEGMSGKDVETWLLRDRWHPNDRGHAIYAELLCQLLCQQGILTPQ